MLRGNRVNCAHFSTSIDWLISRLDWLEASTGLLNFLYFLFFNYSHKMFNILQQRLLCVHSTYKFLMYILSAIII